jgi:hypothetical protein
MKARLLVAGPIAVVASLALAASAAASGRTAVVTTNTDTGSTAGCELRAAIDAVIADATVGGCTVSGTGGDDHVNFDPSMSGQTIVLNGSQLIVNDPLDDLDISGPGMNQLTISGNDLSRVFLVQTRTSITGMSLVHGKALLSAGVAQGGAIESTANVSFGLTLTDVKVANSAATATTASAPTAFADGGGIHSTGPLFLNRSVVTGNSATATQTGLGATDAEARGGAIFNQDDVTITDSTISNNQATATTDGTGQAAATAGIRSDGHLEMSGSTMSGNVANATGTSGPARARGALYETFGSVSNLEQSTIVANKADAIGGSLLRVGGLAIANDTNIRSSTIALNGPDTATGVAGANINFEGGANEVENTIITDPRGGGANCAGADPTSDGFNDDFSPGGVSCFGSPAMTDRTDDPLLATAGLQPNGGLTETIALQPASPVIDQGTNADLANPDQDQRGASFLRPVDFSGLPNADNGTDIGAFEVQQACSGFTQPTPSTACPSPPSPPSPPPPGLAGATGQRAAALKKCKKLKGKKASKRKKCIKRAKKLPV